jgi:hypothetical protein
MTIFFGAAGVAAYVLEWTGGKAFFFTIVASLCGIASIQLIILGVLGELVINTSDLTHASLPEISVKEIFAIKE